MNAYDVLMARAEQCMQERRLLPTIVAVDFYDQGDLLKVAQDLNERRPEPARALRRDDDQRGVSRGTATASRSASSSTPSRTSPTVTRTWSCSERLDGERRPRRHADRPAPPA